MLFHTCSIISHIRIYFICWIQASKKSYLYNVFARISAYRDLKFLDSSPKPRDRSSGKIKPQDFHQKCFDVKSWRSFRQIFGWNWTFLLCLKRIGEQRVKRMRRKYVGSDESYGIRRKRVLTSNWIRRYHESQF